MRTFLANSVCPQTLWILQVGNVHSQIWPLHPSNCLAERALKHYEVTLTDPRDASDETRRFRLEVLATAMAVAAYEVSPNASSKGWIGWKTHMESIVTHHKMFAELDTVGLCQR